MSSSSTQAELLPSISSKAAAVLQPGPPIPMSNDILSNNMLTPIESSSNVSTSLSNDIQPPSTSNVKKPAPTDYTTDEEDIITYDVEEDEIEQHPNLVEKDGRGRTHSSDYERFYAANYHFCGNNLCERYTRYRDKLKQIVHDSKRAILSISTAPQLTELLRNLQESHFPIQILKLPNSLRKANAFIWNCLTESWQEIQADKEKDSHMNNLWNAICTYLEEYRKSGNYGGSEPEVTQKFSINAVISTITSDINMERKRFKWIDTNGLYVRANATPDLASTLFNCRIVTTEELEGKLNENRVKQITGNSCVTFRNMYESSQGGIPTAKLFTTTNNLPDCRATEAFQDRVVAIPFMSRFVNKAPFTTSEQVRLNRYGKDEYVVERSYIGCFLVLVYHLKKCMDIKNGLLHYRDEPPSVVEYTKIYLFNTDVYNQFKTHMDVQESLNAMTTMTDLRSAVRQFLKSTKNNTTPETDLILKFEEEFSECRRRSDFQLGQYNSILDQTSDTLTLENSSLQEEEGPKRSLPEIEGPRKRQCKSMDTAVVYYENVIIRNLRKMGNEN
ncbi:SF3 helicase domain-containing protein [Trichonephila clavipes]|nr:SF3 helicase domain-containing protein [Trichonephila clavipes]